MTVKEAINACSKAAVDYSLALTKLAHNVETSPLVYIKLINDVRAAYNNLEVAQNNLEEVL